MASDSTASPVAPARPSLIAPLWHTFSFLLLLAFLAVLDAQHAHKAQTTQDAGPAQTAATHVALLRAYLLPILYEWGIAAWAWGGVLFKGGHLRDLAGHSTNWRSLALDVAIAIPFWGVWEMTKRLILLALARVQKPTTPYHPPSGFSEVFFWILLSVSAGICEEIVYRGYFQQQFRAATRSIVVAIPLQGLLFGLVHAYQGWSHVIVIVALGILYGTLVAWRRNLHASMLAHAWSDLFEGWLRFL
jgi:membrane protease YdiL (CAAX protease family)